MFLKPLAARMALVGALILGCGVITPDAVHANPAAPALKIAVVDLNQAMNSVEEGKAAIASLEKRFEERRIDLDKRQRELQAMQDDLEKKGMVMSEEAKRNKARELQEKFAEYRNIAMEAETEMGTLRSQMQDSLAEKLKGVCAEIARKQGYTLIVEKNVAWYAAPEYDITDEVIKAYNARPKK